MTQSGSQTVQHQWQWLMNEKSERPYNHNRLLSTLQQLSQFTSTNNTFISRTTGQPAALFYNIQMIRTVEWSHQQAPQRYLRSCSTFTCPVTWGRIWWLQLEGNENNDTLQVSTRTHITLVELLFALSHYNLSMKWNCPFFSHREVKISQPFSVTSSVCSNWADSIPSTVTAVHLSGHISSRQLPV